MRNASESRCSFVLSTIGASIGCRFGASHGCRRARRGRRRPGTRIGAKGGSRNPIHCDGSCVYVVVERSRRVLGARPPLHVATDRASPSGGASPSNSGALFLRRRAASRCPFARGGTIEEAGHEAARRQLQEFSSLPNAMLWTACLADCQYFGQIAWRGSQSSFALRNKTRCRILKQRLIYRAFRPVGEMALTKIA